MDIDNIYEAFKENKKVVFTDSFNEKAISVISMIEKDSDGTYNIYDEDANCFSTDCVESFDSEKVKDYQVNIKGGYDFDKNVIDEIIANAFCDNDVVYDSLIVKTVS